MKILFINERSGYFGGVEQNVAVTAQGLRTKGHICFLAYGERTNRDADRYESLFERAFLCSDIQRTEQKPQGRSLLDMVEQISPDVLYLHKVPQTEFCMPFVNKIRSVRMIHDHDVCCPRRHKYFFHNARVCNEKAGWRCYLDLAFLEKSENSRVPRLVSIQSKLVEMRRNQRFDMLLVGSRFMRNELLLNGFPDSKVRILPPVVPVNPMNITPVPDEPNILCVAQLIRGKGIDLLLQALSKVSCDFRATIVGTGNAEPGLKALCADLKLNDRVIFRGWVNNDEIGSFYDAAKVVAVPCRWPEPFGMIGLEAMRRGRPAAAFDVGGISDWLTHKSTGLLVPEQDVTAFAAALEELLGGREPARQMGLKALETAAKRFSFDSYLERTVEYLSG